MIEEKRAIITLQSFFADGERSVTQNICAGNETAAALTAMLTRIALDCEDEGKEQ